MQHFKAIDWPYKRAGFTVRLLVWIDNEGCTRVVDTESSRGSHFALFWILWLLQLACIVVCLVARLNKKPLSLDMCYYCLSIDEGSPL